MVTCLGPSRGAVPAAGLELGMALAPGMLCGPDVAWVEGFSKPELGGVGPSRVPLSPAVWLPGSPPARRGELQLQLQPLFLLHLPFYAPKQWFLWNLGLSD